MRISKDIIVTLRQRVSDPEGRVIDEGAEPIRYLHGGYGGIFPVLEAALDGKEVGDVIQMTLAPEDAFGVPDPRLIVTVPLAQLAAPPEVGQEVERDFAGASVTYRIAAVGDGKAELDANHPLAGKTLVFSATVAEVRRASPEEVATEIGRLKRDVTEGRGAERAVTEAKAAAEAEAEAADLAEAEAADLVETVYVAQLGRRVRFVFRSQTHKLFWLAPMFLLPAIAAWLGYRGWEAACGITVALWVAWTFAAPAVIRVAIDRWGYRFLFFDFSPNQNPSPLERRIVTGGQVASFLAVLGFTVVALFHLDHLSDIWSLLGADIAILFALTTLLAILLPFLVIVLTAFRIRPVIDKAQERPQASEAAG